MSPAVSVSFLARFRAGKILCVLFVDVPGELENSIVMASFVVVLVDVFGSRVGLLCASRSTPAGHNLGSRASMVLLSCEAIWFSAVVSDDSSILFQN